MIATGNHHGYHCLDPVLTRFISLEVLLLMSMFLARVWPSSSLPTASIIFQISMSFDLTHFYSQLQSDLSAESSSKILSLSPEKNSLSILDDIQSSHHLLTCLSYGKPLYRALLVLLLWKALPFLTII